MPFDSRHHIQIEVGGKAPVRKVNDRSLFNLLGDNSGLKYVKGQKRTKGTDTR